MAGEAKPKAAKVAKPRMARILVGEKGTDRAVAACSIPAN